MTPLPYLYGILAVSRIVMQVGTAAIDRARKPTAAKYPPATLVVAVYNEPIKDFIAAAQSFVAQDYPDLQIIVVDDGSANAVNIRRVCEKLGIMYVHQPNAGKRAAMFTAFKWMDPASKVVLTADSDTVWQPDAARALVDTLLSYPNTGAVTGEVAVSNERDNLLTRLIAIRYHIAFLHERASQSYFGNVTCVSGPLGAYRRDVIDAIQHDFVGQMFMGKHCTYGDDRHLTNLVLARGYKVRYAARAKCYTKAPNMFWPLVKQQTRWSKSYWREMLWQLRVLPKHGPYMAYDWIVSLVLPFLLAYSLLYHAEQIAQGSEVHIALVAGTLVGMSVLRVLEPLVRTRRPVFLLFVCYAFIYFAVMLPSKFWALATINDGKWGTR